MLTPVARVRGTHVSIPHEVPIEAVGDLFVQLDIPVRAEFEDVRNQVRVSVYAKINEVWVLGRSALWLGGRTTGPLPLSVRDPPPVFLAPIVDPVTGADMRGQAVRVEIEVLRSMRVGVSVTSSTPF